MVGFVPIDEDYTELAFQRKAMLNCMVKAAKDAIRLAKVAMESEEHLQGLLYLLQYESTAIANTIGLITESLNEEKA